jgi:hypothetical protein
MLQKAALRGWPVHLCDLVHQATNKKELSSCLFSLPALDFGFRLQLREWFLQVVVRSGEIEGTPY